MPGDYSEELVELVSDVADTDYGSAVRILDALSSAGRLVSEGSEVREEWGVRWPDGRKTWHYADQETARTYATAYPDEPDGVVLHRRVLTTPPTPWTPAEPAQEEQ